MERDPQSHKGENGKLAIVGGSRHCMGAPIFSALAALGSGIDTLSLCIPRCHLDAAKSWVLNAFWFPFAGDDLGPKDIEPILELIAPLDALVLGSGMALQGERIPALETIIASTTTPMVLDATALQKTTLKLLKGKNAILTPHLGELERMGLEPKDLPGVAQEFGVVIFLKGPQDRLFSPLGNIRELSGGNAGLTVGGTGDALAGLIGGLIAQHIDPFEACIKAGTIVKRAGEKLLEEKGYAYDAPDVIGEIPRLLKSI